MGSHSGRLQTVSALYALRGSTPTLLFPPQNLTGRNVAIRLAAPRSLHWPGREAHPPPGGDGGHGSLRAFGAGGPRCWALGLIGDLVHSPESCWSERGVSVLIPISHPAAPGQSSFFSAPPPTSAGKAHTVSSNERWSLSLSLSLSPHLSTPHTNRELGG